MIWERVLRFRYMITEQAKERCRILAFWERHGTEATKEAFRISRRTLFRWQGALKKKGGQLEGLNALSKSPYRRRQRKVAEEIIKKIIELRTLHPHLGKEKIHALIKYQGSVSTIGRVLSDLKEKGALPSGKKFSMHANTGRLIERKPKKTRKKLRRPKGYRVLEVDTVVRFIDGVKRYIITATDTEQHTAFAACYTNHGSTSASDFLKKCVVVLPDCPIAVQTDNGSEFALHFDRACEKLSLERFHTYPRSPKMNAHVERFNRTLDEEFLQYHRALLRDDVKALNDALVDWLLWYNGERPHHSLSLLSPFQSIFNSLPANECQMWWTNTHI
jgi:transposase InsO family protein